jgi:hypothetical protein
MTSIAASPHLSVVNSSSDQPDVSAAIVERRGSMVILTIDGGLRRDAYRFHAACPIEGLSWERRADESWQQFVGRSRQCARAAGSKLLIRGGWPNVPHDLEILLADKGDGLADGEAIIMPLGD